MKDRMTTTKLADWLRPQLTSGVRVIPGRLPDIPNRVVGVQMGSGPGLVNEDITDIISFQISCRGGENNLADAEDIALEVDDILISNSKFTIAGKTEGTFVEVTGRTGGSPTQLSIPDSQSRFTFTCNYFAYVSTNIGQVFNG